MSSRTFAIVAGVLIGTCGILGQAPAVAAPPEAEAVAASPWAAVTAATRRLDRPDCVGQHGGRVLEIRFRTWEGAVGFTAVVANRDDTVSHVSVAIPELKVVVIAAADIPDWMAPWQVRADKRSIWKAKIPLADAVVMAQKMTGGVPVDAGLAKPLTADNAVLSYNIEIVKDGRPQRVVIDAETGGKVANPDTSLEAWKPEDALMRSLKMKP